MEHVSSWQEGTIAQGSSVHAPNTFEGEQRSYNDSFAIDGDQITFWNECVFLRKPELYFEQN